MPDDDGGWALDLACVGCETRQTFHDVVPSLILDQVRRAGWDYDGTPPWRGDQAAVCPEHVHA